MNCHWSLAHALPDQSAALAASLEISPLLAQCLINRGHSEAECAAKFLEPKLRDLADPFLIPNMEKAVARLLVARARDETVVIFGDYDVDGVTSTALLFQSLTALGWIVKHYLPSRMDEGYGLSADAVENCLRQFGRFLLLAIDCGSTASAVIDSLRERGVDVIVVDHHQISEPAPRAVALVNPRVRERFHELCSVGLAFKLLHALLKQMRADGVALAEEFDARQFLDLTALGTIADIVPLNGENRILVHAGLQYLDRTRRPGLRALQCVAQTKPPHGVYEVAFQLAPRLNAAGRLQDAEEALQLLLCTEGEAAAEMARALNERNRERQELEKAICEEALAAVRQRFVPEQHFVIVEGSASWHIGVVGIVASRVLQQYYRPTIILGGDGETWRGSGRSIDGFDLAAALRECAEHLLRHGGHAMAAGLSIDGARIVAFRERLNDLARAALQPHQLRPKLALDAVIPLSELTLERLEELGRLEPCGAQNPNVRFVARRVALQQPPQRMGRENQHAKLRLTDGTGFAEAVWWNCGETSMPEGFFDLAFAPSINEYKGRRAVQLKVLDWRPADYSD